MSRFLLVELEQNLTECMTTRESVFRVISHTSGVRRVLDASLKGAVDCERPGCRRAVETYCPLCGKLLCKKHDELVAYRGHDCLSGTADA